jgi:hypothetical protein
MSLYRYQLKYGGKVLGEVWASNEEIALTEIEVQEVDEND